MANAKMDENSRATLTAMSSANDGTIVQLWADPTLHALLTTSSGGTNFVDAETPSGAVNGANTIFVLAHTPSPALSLQFVVNGQVLTAVGVDYTLSTATVTVNTAPPTDSIVRAWYRY